MAEIINKMNIIRHHQSVRKVADCLTMRGVEKDASDTPRAKFARGPLPQRLDLR
jgi:hypothetical protein